MKICFVTSVHPRDDVRIYIKELLSLANYGYDISFIVADGLGNDPNKNIFDVGKPNNRLERLFNTSRKITKLSKQINADVYHFHDPELIRFGNKMKNYNKKVIYDIHEDLPRQLLTKPYLKFFFPKIISKIVEKWENKYAQRFDFLITPTDHINERFLAVNPNTITIKNYPIIDEFYISESIKSDRKTICYIGALTEVRGIYEIVEAVKDMPIELLIAGTFHDKYYENKVIASHGWKKVTYLGQVDRRTVNRIMNKSKAGIVTLYPTPNYLTSLPVKMFEYMAAGIPVIASNFPVWKQIIDENKCGICIESRNIIELKKAIEFILFNPKESQVMGENGRIAVLNKYNWSGEEKKLLELYKGLKDFD